MFKKILKIFLIVSTVLIVLCGSFILWVSDKHVTPIMMYHNVNYSDKPWANTVSPEHFARQMAYLRDQRYNVVSFKEVVDSIWNKKKLPKKTVVITFDDGYEDNYKYAFPILKQYHFPAIIFVVTYVVGKPEFLTWEQIKEMEKNGISFGSHTRLHVYLPSVDQAEQRNQIQISREIMEQQLGHRVEYFAYPTGGFNDSIIELLKQSKYKAACTTNRGWRHANENPYIIKRIRFGEDDSDFSLWGKLSGYYQVFKKYKSPE